MLSSIPAYETETASKIVTLDNFVPVNAHLCPKPFLFTVYLFLSATESNLSEKNNLLLPENLNFRTNFYPLREAFGQFSGART